ncbi:MAG: hypothetical protein HQK72_10485 [Desulfamplus sp.]|nr:hypothetical protein [Desulfamplus sp.]
MKTDNSNMLKKGFLRIWIIWGAMFGSLLMYVVICHILEPTWKPIVDAGFPLKTFNNALFVAAIAAFFLSNYIRKFILKSESQLARFREIAARTNINPVIFKYQTAVIISLAISESIGIFGFIIFLLSKDINTFYIFIAISAASMIYNIPKVSEIE